MKHMLFFCPRVAQLWWPASLPFPDSPMEQSAQSFLKTVQISSEFDATWRAETKAAYIAYQI